MDNVILEWVQGPVQLVSMYEKIQQHSTHTEVGALATFAGIVRADTIQGQVVQSIRFTAYTDMAMAALSAALKSIELVKEAHRIQVFHSLGEVPTGACCMWIVVESKRRVTALQLCAEIVEVVKFQLPIWGEEIVSDTHRYWKENT
ncbi:MAG: molybdenum cofactor biosynthesis protein MoaE [Cytophagaceae bacterium]|jgi:molybdopterin synthase catalytic subunit|nr:molybdenum cofactor biosynthesis protein MoaE [Cytophagaceae bacterium]